MLPPLTSIPSLLAALEAVPDHRRAAGRRHGLPSVLAFLCCGMLCGNRSLLALAEWGRAHQAWCCQTFGFKRCPRNACRPLACQRLLTQQLQLGWAWMLGMRRARRLMARAPLGWRPPRCVGFAAPLG